MSDVVDLSAVRNEAHLVVKELCMLCSHACVGVIPIAAPQDALECGACHQMTSRVTHVHATDDTWVERSIKPCEVKPFATRVNQNIVQVLEEELAKAKTGATTGLFLFTRYVDGTNEHTRDGITDADLFFWMDLVKHRILEKY